MFKEKNIMKRLLSVIALVAILTGLIVPLVQVSPAAAETEDFTDGWIEVDPVGTWITPTSSRVSFSVRQNDAAYYYKDYGAGYFSGNFIHRFQQATTVVNNSGRTYTWGISDVIGNITDNWTKGCYLRMYYATASGISWTLGEVGGSTNATAGIIEDANYHISIYSDSSVGNHGKVTAYIASANYYENGGTLYDTLSITLANDLNYQYLYAVNTYHSTGSSVTGGYIQNLEISGTAPIVSTLYPSSVNTTGATLRGNVVHVGSSNVTRGFQYAQHGAEDWSGNITDTGPYEAGIFSADLNGLTSSTLYTCRAFATNDSETAYGDNITFQTKPFTLTNPYSGGTAYKGNLHTHTDGSDGSYNTTTVVTMYRDAGYDFLAITDHNVNTADPEVSGILFIPGIEDTIAAANPVHLNAIGTTNNYDVGGLQVIIDSYVADGALCFANHPNASSSADWTTEQLASTTNLTAVNIWDGTHYPSYYSYGESKWIHALANNPERLWNEACDDYHTDGDKFKGWIVAYVSGDLTWANLKASLQSGNYYSSAGAMFSDISVDEYTISVSTNVSSTIFFKSPLTGILQTTNEATSANYTATGGERCIYVQIVNNDGQAWTNPIWIDEYTPSSTPTAPSDFSATDGTNFSSVNLTWTDNSNNESGFYLYRDDALIATLDPNTNHYEDTGAAAGTITPGTLSASDGTSNDYVTISIAGENTANGTVHTFKLSAFNESGATANVTDTGFRLIGEASLQLKVSSGDADSDYSNISGATSEPYNYTSAPSNGDRRYYKGTWTATGATSQDTNANPGFRGAPPVLSSVGNQSGTTNSTLQFTASATGIGTIQYSLDSEPAGSTINTSSGLFSWTPDTAGTYSGIVVIATNEYGSDNETIQIIISDAPVATESEYTRGQLMAQSIIPILTVVVIATFAIGILLGEVTLAALILLAVGIIIGISFLGSTIAGLF